MVLIKLAVIRDSRVWPMDRLLLLLRLHMPSLTSVEGPIVVDMATTTVPFGRVEVYARKGEQLPSDTWAIDADGQYDTLCSVCICVCVLCVRVCVRACVRAC